MPNPFIDAQDLTDYLGRDVTNDPGALIALDAACDTCRAISEQEFNAGTATLYPFDGNDGDCILLAQRPVNNVGTVVVNGGTVTDYMFTLDGRLLRGTAGGYPRPTWPLGRQNVRVTYGYGYEAADFPRDVRMVALALASRLVVQGVAVSEQQGAVRIDYAGAADELTANEERILRKYKQSRGF